MAITEIRILPPLAIGRLGSSSTPLEAYELAVSKTHPLDYRRIVPRETLRIDPDTGAVAESYIPRRILFRDGPQIRPVAPFLEVYARAEENVLVPLTLDLLAAEGLNARDIRWSVLVGNIKVFRRTGQPDDKVIAGTGPFNDNAVHALEGRCVNFLPDRTLPLGHVRYIQPTREFPSIRLRFTPGTGKVYGSSRQRYDPKQKKPVDDPIIRTDEQVLYDAGRGSWRGYFDKGGATDTNPGSIYAGYPDADGHQISWGYLDDECDGVVSVELARKEGPPLVARAHVCAGPPAFAPDSLPIRTVADDLEQILAGPSLDADAIPLDEAEEIVRRALDTVRLMNTAVMNANTIDGRANVASTMARQDTADFGRQFGPIMASSLVDNLAVRALHERVFAALSSGSAPWFIDVIRQPEEIGDFTDKGRRKMPALMRGADGRMLTLTRRQIDTVLKAATHALFHSPPTPPPHHG